MDGAKWSAGEICGNGCAAIDAGPMTGASCALAARVDERQPHLKRIHGKHAKVTFEFKRKWRSGRDSNSGDMLLFYEP
jgi:hypothetical protein